MSDDAPSVALTSAAASCRVHMDAGTVDKVVANDLKKGDVLGVARFAGIRAASSTPSLLPEAPAALDPAVSVTFDVASTYIDVRVVVSSSMGSETSTQALAAALVASLTIYDMCKAVDHSMVIDSLELVSS